MQVTQIDDHVSHAVISNNKARDFSISNSAEFFNILSSTLYSDKILAVVREVLCNAWDIHIQTGRTDQPVLVTLGEGKLTIRDFGTGIADEDMVDVYCTYGNSTKKLDGKQTGGFGLGCKAAFATVDHFDVTSWHNSNKTVYAISKSSAEVAGKPSIMPIVSVPCGSETGLMVSLAYKPEERDRYEEVIRQIARFGEMNVHLNGTPIKTIAFSEAEHGFLMIRNDISLKSSDQIYIRYGNVVYPVPVDDSIQKRRTEIETLINKIGNRSYYDAAYKKWRIIFQAKPNTISVTPSRESLSMTPTTIASINELFESFIQLTDTKLEQECLILDQEGIERTFKFGRPGDLLTSNNEIPKLIDKTNSYTATPIYVEPEKITTLRQMGSGLMSTRFPQFKDFEHKDTLMRLNVLEKNQFGGKTNRGKLQSFRKAFDSDRFRSNPSAWFQSVIVQPLLRKLDAEPDLVGSKLLVYGRHSDRRTDKNGRRLNYNEGLQFIEANKLSSRRRLSDYMGFLRNVVVIAYNRGEIENRLSYFPIMRQTIGQPNDILVYITPRTTDKVAAALKFFEDAGYTVVDMTKRQSWEPEEVNIPTTKPKVVKPRKKGLIKANEAVQKEADGKWAYAQTRLTPDKVEQFDYPRTETPQFVLKVNPRSDNMQPTLNINGRIEASLVALYGDQGGIVVNENQLARFTNELKVPRFQDWLYAKIGEIYKTNQNIRTQFSYNLERTKLNLKMGYEQRRAYELIKNNPELSIEFGFLNILNEEEQLLVELYEELSTNYHTRYDKAVVDIKKDIEDIPASTEAILLGEKIMSAKLLSLLDFHEYKSIFENDADATKKQRRQGALDILQYALA